MTSNFKRLSKTTAIAALALSSMMGAFAEDAVDQHHPKDPAAAEVPAAPSQPAQPGASAAPQQNPGMGGMGMMGGDHMPKMMQMMQDMHGKMMMGGGMAMQPKGDTGPSSLAFNGIMTKMHQDMAITYTGNADVDFINGMIPHHQAAVDMAKTVIAFGKDKDVKELAEDVIKAQEKEIAEMKEWLKKHGSN
jgi:uncharacterized protein (DUF305 family)